MGRAPMCVDKRQSQVVLYKVLYRLRQQHHPGLALLLKGEAGTWRSLRHSVVKRDQNCSRTSHTKIS